MSSVPYAEVYYNQVRAKASHNSYQRTEGLSDQFAYWRLRSLELDLHNGNDASGWPKLDGDWYVYHSSPFDVGSTVRTFEDALQVLAGFHAAVPDHEVCTIALDIKDNFDPTHTPEQLDALINAALPGAVYTPADLLGTHSNLQQSAGQWPRLADLRGKFVFILTTGNLDSPTSHLNQYVQNGATANIRTGFVAPNISTVAQITAFNYAVWFNLTMSAVGSLGPKIFAQGFMSRAYGANSSSDWQKAVTGKAHLIGTDKVNAEHDTWARTDNTHGWPFQGIEFVVDPNTVEPGTIDGLRVKSGDFWGKADSGAMLPFAAGVVDRTHTWGVSVPASHVPDDWGKSGLMVRASAAADAANFALLRAAEGHPMRVQVRASTGGSTSAWDLNPGTSGVNAATWMYLRLVVSNGGRTVEGLGSTDGVNWVSVHRQDFTESMTLQGLAGSSHDTGKSIRYLYFPVGTTAAASLTPINIGKDVQATGFSGVYPV